MITTRSELRKVLFLALWLFCLWIKYLWNRWTDLHQIHMEDVFGPSLRRVWMSRSKVIRKKHALWLPSPPTATVWSVLLH